MSYIAKFLAASAAALALLGAAEARSDRYDYGCASSGDRAVGTLVGAVIGGVVGGQFGNDGDDRAFGAVAGALLGGAAGNAAANGDCYQDGYVDDGYEDDRYDSAYYDDGYEDPYAQAAYYDAFENADPYERVTWNGNTGYANYVEAREWYADDDGRDCREFEQVIYIDGRRQTAVGTACREYDGTWRIVE